MTGRPISELQRDTVSPLAGYPVRDWALAPRDRTVLHERLEARSTDAGGRVSGRGAGVAPAR